MLHHRADLLVQPSDRVVLPRQRMPLQFRIQFRDAVLAQLDLLQDALRGLASGDEGAEAV